ncbi:methionyl-tRNA formyltransferase [Aerococcus kribbianus]|uniref:Methionyl-tRNA formyltransferase n=1 Tax=Aerococcus kribbianus TaxID=2999064 RepID=A0A9X3JEI8_9LACT|nr:MULTISPECIES: methionyl-tRNA formyltransferase [unclassified Aerococcus]MCZ0717199.1 methionyl-tRNA formyltransferase [Aerococcus sp. YH-aer221]MCZ0725487.1 methionyl-tRNA formyltransferase [Aerococcus sp. YH-aer222]
MKRIVFMGTPEFSVPILQALNEEADYEVVGVVTQPDRPVGRKKKLQASPVKQAALEADLPVYQPERIASDQKVYDLLAADIDVIITAAYGQFLPTKLLDLPKLGALNVHASALPKYRGGAPVHYAIWQGETETGVSIMRMVKAMDAGPVLAQATQAIGPDDTVEELFNTLSLLGRDLLIATLPAFWTGDLEEVPQDEAKASYSPNITRDQERVEWEQTAQAIHNQIRAMNSWPVAHTLMGGQRWKLWKSSVPADQSTDQAPGTIIKIQKKPAQFWVAAGEDTVLALEEIQPAGKKRMPIASFINGGSGGLDVGDQFQAD